MWRSIHEDLPHAHDCGAELTRIYTVPLTSARVRASDPALQSRLDADAQFARDHPAYKRLRDSGVQPRGIDGSAEMETRANDPLEVEMGKVMDARDVKEGRMISEDMNMGAT